MSIAEHVTGLQHLGLPTAALDETAAFYESLGFVRAHSTVNPGTGERVCFLTCGGLCIETYECAAPARRPEPSTTWPWTWTTLSPPGRKCGWPAWPRWKMPFSSSPSGRTACAFSTTGPQRRDGGVQPEAVGRAASGCDWSVRRYLTHFFVQN